MYSEFCSLKEANKFTVEHSVYVSNDFHGKGIGKVILSELIVLAKQQGLHTMIGVIDENQSSVDFHEKLFQNCRSHKDVAYKLIVTPVFAILE
jgi:phosphinothricin acetyltransferase